MTYQALIEDTHKELLNKKNVVGVGIGHKWTNGQSTKNDSLLVFVSKKESNTILSPKDRISNEINGYTTDVVGKSGKFSMFTLNQRVRPLKPGYSCGHLYVTAGTIGGFFKDREGHIVMLSNNHVLACFDDKTEVLTKYGFKLWKNITINDEIATLNKNNCIEYNKPKELINYYYDGEMIEFKSRFIDMVVTPNHKIWCKKCFHNDYGNKNKDFSFELIESNEILKYKTSNNKSIKFQRWSDWSGLTDEDVIKSIDKSISNNIKINFNNWLKFLGLYLAEGSTTYAPPYNKKSRRSELFITSVRNKNINLLYECKNWLNSLGFKAFVNEKSWYCRSYDKTLYNYLKQFGKSHEKFIPNEIKQLNKNKLEIILSTLVAGDGCIPTRSTNRKLKNYVFTLKSKKLIDDLQEITIKLNGTASIIEKHGSTFNKNGLYYTINMVWTNLEPVVKIISKIKYSGMVYCADVKNHVLLVRRNGKIAWSGNCTNRGVRGNVALQPGLYDNTNWQNNIVGNLKYYRPLVKSNEISFDAVRWTGILGYNLEDSAIAVVANPDQIITDYPTIGTPAGFRNDMNINEKVQKVGRTTEYTTGNIIATNSIVTVNYGITNYLFKDQIVTNGMAQGGDSGSLLFDMNNNIIGQLFAGSDTITLYNKI